MNLIPVEIVNVKAINAAEEVVPVEGIPDTLYARYVHPVGVRAHVPDGSPRIFPNPAAGQVPINWSKPPGGSYQIEMYDVRGTLRFRREERGDAVFMLPGHTTRHFSGHRVRREDTEPHRGLIINGKNSVYSVLASVLSVSETILSSGVLPGSLAPGIYFLRLTIADGQQFSARLMVR